jgi:hypothetical protein
MVVLPPTSASCYHNWCIDDGTRPEYFGFFLVWVANQILRRHTKDTISLEQDLPWRNQQFLSRSDVSRNRTFITVLTTTTIFLYTETHQSRPRFLSHKCRIHYNIVLPSITSFSKESFSSMIHNGELFYTAVCNMTAVFKTPCSLVQFSRRFRESYCYSN